MRCVLILHHPDDRRQILWRKPSQNAGQRLSAFGIVPAVQKHIGASGDPLHTPVHDRFRKPRSHMLHCDPAQKFCGFYDGNGIFHLMHAAQRDRIGFAAVTKYRLAKTFRQSFSAFWICRRKRVVPFFGGRAQNLHRFRRLVRRGDAVPAFFQNTCLFSGDLPERIAEHGSVIERYGSDHAHKRARDDVGGVEPPAEPHLEHNNVAVRLIKIQQCRRSDRLKLRGTLPRFFRFFNRCLYTCRDACEFRFPDILMIDLHAFAEREHVR